MGLGAEAASPGPAGCRGAPGHHHGVRSADPGRAQACPCAGEITPTGFNYLVDITGAYAGGRYRFMRRYRSGFEDNLGREFDDPFARIDRMGRDNFDVHWMRHTGQWWPLHYGLPLAGALQAVVTDDVFQP